MIICTGVFENNWNWLAWNWNNINMHQHANGPSSRQPPCCQCRWSQHQPTISSLSRPFVMDRVNMTPFLFIKHTTHTTYVRTNSTVEPTGRKVSSHALASGPETPQSPQTPGGATLCDDALGWRGAFGHYEEADRDFVGTRDPTQDILNLCSARGRKAGKERTKRCKLQEQMLEDGKLDIITWHFCMHSTDQSTNVTLFGFCQATDCHRPLLSTRPWRTNVAPPNVEATWGSYADPVSEFLCIPSHLLTSHIPPPQTQRLSRSKTFGTRFCQCVKYRICDFFCKLQKKQQKTDKNRGAFMTAQPQWDHLSIQNINSPQTHVTVLHSISD